MDGQIADDVKRRRRDEIMEAQQAVSQENGQKRIGTVMEVEIEGYMASDEVYAGRTYADTPGVDGYCFVKSGRMLESGDFVKATITGATEYDLVGEAEDEEGEEE
jgi:ribosomal protein S12 methylthiotransferase